jgi:hypothetical protein
MKNTNRMAWIRLLEDLEASPAERRYSTEYEFVSECRITGRLEYAGGAIVCTPYTFEKDENGLHHYLLTLSYPADDGSRRERELTELMQGATPDGYYFRDGAAGELLSLLSLALRCRLYLVASVHVSGDTRIKREFKINHRRVDPDTHPAIFDDRARNFVRDLPPLLDHLRSTTIGHQRAALAAYHYARALREVGLDTEMIFIRLVSAIEVLSQRHPLSARRSPLDGLDFERAFGGARLTDKQRDELRQVLGVSRKGHVRIEKSRRRFISFIDEYSKGAIKGGNYKGKHLKIGRTKLVPTLDAIYRARSRYLHSGEPMYPSYDVAGRHNWDTDPSSGMWVDNRRFDGEDKLPYPRWFENIVRHCILKYLHEMK